MQIYMDTEILINIFTQRYTDLSKMVVSLRDVIKFHCGDSDSSLQLDSILCNSKQ